MTILGFFDVRPFLFAGGLPLFVGLSLLVFWLVKSNARKWKVAISSALMFTVCFILFLTGVGPFVDQKETREYWMTWDIKPTPSDGMRESEVVLTFEDFPRHYIGDYSDELANDLREQGERRVKAVFAVNSDYGKVRGFRLVDIGGLRQWRSEFGYGGSSGSSADSPWD